MVLAVSTSLLKYPCKQEIALYTVCLRHNLALYYKNAIFFPDWCRCVTRLPVRAESCPRRVSVSGAQSGGAAATATLHSGQPDSSPMLPASDVRSHRSLARCSQGIVCPKWVPFKIQLLSHGIIYTKINMNRFTNK